MWKRHLDARKRADYRAGVLAAVVASSQSGRAYQPSDFFNALEESEPEEMSGAAMKAFILRFHEQRKKAMAGGVSRAADHSA